MPMLGRANIHYEMADRTRGIACGGVALILRLVLWCGLRSRIDRALSLLRVHLPYHESDHVLNMAFNILAGGKTLDDIELLRNDANYLDALGAERIPDPTTAGDFCRRFGKSDVCDLMEAINETRLDIWKTQPPSFFEGICLAGRSWTFRGSRMVAGGVFGVRTRGPVPIVEVGAMNWVSLAVPDALA